MSRIGVLALQGGFDAHREILEGLGHEAPLVRCAAELEGLDGLVFPGGESSAMLKLIGLSGLWDALDAAVRGGMPVLATCAGMILSATDVTDPAQDSFGWLDIDVSRNGWGRQIHSFEARDDDDAMPLVFIRAPRISRVGDAVEVIARYRGEPIAVTQGCITAASFHPELAKDPTLHRRVFATG